MASWQNAFAVADAADAEARRPHRCRTAPRVHASEVLLVANAAVVRGACVLLVREERARAVLRRPLERRAIFVLRDGTV